MNEPTARLWLIQADSDLDCAQRAWDETDDRTYCQVIAKYQQVVEKSVKAIFTAIKEVGVGLPAVGYSHDLKRQLDTLERLPRPRNHRDLQILIDGVLTQFHRAEIQEISLLAPKPPGIGGGLHRRNTEYPFETAPGIWTTPAVAGTFGKQQVVRFRTLAVYLYQRACKICGSLRV